MSLSRFLRCCLAVWVSVAALIATAAIGQPLSSANRNLVSNAGFVVTPAGVVVIDALGSPQLARELMEREGN